MNASTHTIIFSRLFCYPKDIRHVFYPRFLNVTVGMKQKLVPVFVPNCIPVIITHQLFSHMHARDETTSIGLAGIP